MKITAKGMFKRLGYERQDLQNEQFIVYKKQYKSSIYCITFDLINKTYEANYYGPKGGCCPYILSIKEMLAIQEQIEELGDEFIYECKRNYECKRDV